MNSIPATVLTLAALMAANASLAQSNSDGCRVLPFRGATSPQGAQAQMHVINTGQPCAIANFGVPGEGRNPAHSGAVTRPPSGGVAEVKAHRAVYTPTPGFEGEDYFEYEAYALGPSGNSLLLRVRVKVSVKAP